jgi:hypothetical protein
MKLQIVTQVSEILDQNPWLLCWNSVFLHQKKEIPGKFSLVLDSNSAAVYDSHR